MPMADDNAAGPADGLSASANMSQHSKDVVRDDSPSADDNAAEKEPQSTAESKKPSKLKQLWQKTGLDAPTLITMFKASLPPTIAIAIFQAKGVQEEYSTIGYLVAITSVLAFAIFPRGKFIQGMIINIFTICLAVAVNLLALFCAIKAREHTTPPGPPSMTVPYNSSASAVLAVWLIFQIYMINTLRASRPQLQFPSILYSIFVIVSLVYGVKFPDMSYVIAFEKRLLEAFLSGFAIATGVHFVIFPLSSRKVVMKEWTGYIGLLGGMLKSQIAYMNSLSTVDPIKLREEHEKEDQEAAQSKHHRKSKPQHKILETPEALKFEELRQKLLGLHNKIEGDITPAKREIAIGKLESHDLTEIWKLMRLVFVPVLGLASMINILEGTAKERGWAEENLPGEKSQSRNRELGSLHFMLKELHAPFSKQVATIDEALQHILLTLELVKPPKKKKQPDEESNDNETAKPGTPAFAEAYKLKVDTFYESKKTTLRDWCQEHDIELPPDFFEVASLQSENLFADDDVIREKYQRQLFFTLYLEYLLWRVSTSVLDLVLYVDKRKQDGIFKRSRIIFPGSKTIYKWLQATFDREDVSQQDSYATEMDAAGVESIYLGQDFGNQPDPEHLPPTNTVERIGESLRAIPAFLRSGDSVHGLRVAAATMTIGVVWVIGSTQDFFLKQRFLWAMIMIAISMTRTSGQSILNYGLRILGTVLSMVASYVIWYIVDGKTAGVIVFLWLWIFISFYVVVKFPQFAMVGILGLITAILIIGYELQVRALGVAIATSNGQPAYPVYELAPYRLATVAGGLFIAFIWTVLPFPISESSEIRKDLTTSLYLMCSFYSIVHEGIKIRCNGTGGDSKIKGTHNYNIEKARYKVFSRLLRLLTNLKTNTEFSKFQLRVGGKFPRETYVELIECLRRITMWTSLASYASSTYQIKEGGEVTKWSSDFRQVLKNLNTSSHRVTSLLSLLSSSLGNAQPLPPYIEVPAPFQFVKMIKDVDRDILSIRHIAEPEYSAFAVMQIASASLSADLTYLVSLVKTLVGEIDFSFHALKSSSPSSSASSDDDKGKVE